MLFGCEPWHPFPGQTCSSLWAGLGVSHAQGFGVVFLSLKKLVISSRRQDVTSAPESGGWLTWEEVWSHGAWR